MTCGAWVIGGGTGIGKATAFRLTRGGYRVAVRGRREEQLTETVREIVEAGGSARAIPVDITGDDAVVAHDAREKESLEVLVRSAGPNMPNRSWSPLTTTDFPRIVDTDPNSVARCVPAVLTRVPRGRLRPDRRGVVVGGPAVHPSVRSGLPHEQESAFLAHALPPNACVGELR